MKINITNTKIYEYITAYEVVPVEVKSIEWKKVKE